MTPGRDHVGLGPPGHSWALMCHLAEGASQPLMDPPGPAAGDRCSSDGQGEGYLKSALVVHDLGAQLELEGVELLACSLPDALGLLLGLGQLGLQARQ